MKNEIKKLTFGSCMVALAVVLTLLSQLIPSSFWPQGGSVTVAAAAPIIVTAIVCGTKWGVISALVYSLIQMATGFYPPPVQTWYYFLIVVLLDYVVAFGVFGLAGEFYRLMKRKIWAIPLSGVIVLAVRYLCHFISGVLIWGVYAPEGQPVWIYSLVYNGLYMVPEIIINAVVLAVLAVFVRRLEEKYV